MGAARFSFHDLCELPLGAARLSSHRARISYASCSIIFRSCDSRHRNEAKRFITLIDTLYDNCVKLVASADAPPHELYLAEEGFEAVEFERTASRLIEMGSQSYLALPHGARQRTAIRRARRSSRPEGLAGLLRLAPQR